jgi:hypothetical protein
MPWSRRPTTLVRALLVTISADHTDVSYADKRVTISGRATQVNPGGTVTPYQGALYLEESWSLGQKEVTANADGNFSAVVAPSPVIGPTPTVSAQIVYGVPGKYADSAEVPVVDQRLVAGLEVRGPHHRLQRLTARRRQ